MSEQRFVLDKLYYTIMTPIEKISVGRNYITYGEVVDLLNEQQATITKLKELNDDKGKRIISLIRINKTLKEENEQLKNELRKEKSLREYSDSMIDVDLIVNIRFSNGEWKADVSVIDDE